MLGVAYVDFWGFFLHFFLVVILVQSSRQGGSHASGVAVRAPACKPRNLIFPW